MIWVVNELELETGRSEIGKTKMLKRNKGDCNAAPCVSRPGRPDGIRQVRTRLRSDELNKCEKERLNPEFLPSKA